jgi:hypothetical protein
MENQVARIAATVNNQLNQPAGTDPARFAGSIAADFWVEAGRVVAVNPADGASCLPCAEVITPEFARSTKGSQSAMESFLLELQDKGEKPKLWGLHNYQDLFPIYRPGNYSSKVPSDGLQGTTLQTYTRLIDHSRLGKAGYEYWVTETGAQLSPKGVGGIKVTSDAAGNDVLTANSPLTSLALDEQAAFDASRKFASMGAWSPGRLTHAIYYLINPPGDDPSAGTFDSALLTKNKNARPAYCGLVWASRSLDAATVAQQDKACIFATATPISPVGGGFGEIPAWAFEGFTP